MGQIVRVPEVRHEHGVHCSTCKAGWYKMTPEAKAAIGKACGCCGEGILVEYEEDVTYYHKEYRCECGKEGQERYSLGIYAGIYCDKCWKKSGYRKEGPEGFDPAYAGERYDPI